MNMSQPHLSTWIQPYLNSQELLGYMRLEIPFSTLLQKWAQLKQLLLLFSHTTVK
jgi:hypothetical protein